MMKAQNADPKHFRLNCTYAQEEKVDGVPGVFIHTRENVGAVISRQGTTLTSSGPLLKELCSCINRVTEECPSLSEILAHPIVGEIKVPEMSFEESAGITRSKKEDERQRLYLFDIQCSRPYSEVAQALDKLAAVSESGILRRPEFFGHVLFSSKNEVTEHLSKTAAFIKQHPGKIEGVMFRPLDGVYVVGKRSWDMQRLVLTPTLDLKVLSFEEATSKGGAPLGMVGRILVGYHEKVIGVGPGKLTHEERRELWKRWGRYGVAEENATLIAQIKHKEPSTYNALRQPTFQRWRPDKEIPDA